VLAPERSSREAASEIARSQVVSRRKPPIRTSGALIRSSDANDWYAKRPLSHSQPSSTSSLSRASTRTTFMSSRTVSSTLHWDGHRVQTVPAPSMSHGRARNRYAREVSAPTGHSSMMLPLNGATYGRPSCVPTNV
jgi:hypothetical protein